MTTGTACGFLIDNKRLFYTITGTRKPLLLLHGNTASSKMFDPIVPLFSEKNTVIRMDFLGCGQSERLAKWPADLWYSWGEQAAALLKHLGLRKVNVIGCSGGALAALNLALDYPELVNAVAADSFEGIRADASITEQIRTGRSYAKQIEGFRLMQKEMHGEDWEQVVDADTEAVVSHAEKIGSFFHRPLSALQPKLLLTGSAEDEMFPAGHYEALFSGISSEVDDCAVHIFEHGGHPALMSNRNEFVRLCEKFF